MARLFITLYFFLSGLLSCLPAFCESPKEPLTITFVGDIMLGRQVGKAIQRAQDPALPFREIAAEIRSSDISIGNLECVFVDTLITGTYNHPIIRFPAYREAARGVKLAGFDYCSIANNHSMDFDNRGVQSTIETLEKNDIIPVGLSSNNPVIMNNKGWQIALFAFWVNHDSLWTVNPETGYEFNDIETVLKEIEQAKKSGSKVILFLHWGKEYFSIPAESQKFMAHRLIDHGADIIIGHGAHQTQEVEYKGNSIIAYSLGNCIFDQKYEETKKGLILKATYNILSESPEVTLLPTRIRDNFVTTLQENPR